jgi:hypothetical protein
MNPDIENGRKHKNHSALFRILLSPFNRKNKYDANRFFTVLTNRAEMPASLPEETE